MSDIVVMSDMEPAVLTPLEASLRLGVSTRTIARWADLGLLPVAHTTSGGQRRFYLVDVQAFVRPAGDAA